MPVTQLNPYIHFNGNAAEAVRHYEEHLGASVVHSMTYGELPGGTPQPADVSRIMHCELRIGAGTLMVSDAPTQHPGIIGTNMEVTLCWGDEAAMRNAFDALVREGAAVVPLHDAFWGGKFGMLRDRFGIHWMFTYGQPAS